MKQVSTYNKVWKCEHLSDVQGIFVVCRSKDLDTYRSAAKAYERHTEDQDAEWSALSQMMRQIPPQQH